ncbi:hypothetical protein ACFE04_010066 [Oxalis oulophora]
MHPIWRRVADACKYVVRKIQRGFRYVTKGDLANHSNRMIGEIEAVSAAISALRQRIFEKLDYTNERIEEYHKLTENVQKLMIELNKNLDKLAEKFDVIRHKVLSARVDLIEKKQVVDQHYTNSSHVFVPTYSSL